MLSLKTFELEVNDTVLRRGRQYYGEGAITDLQETGKGYWYAKVNGTESYTVEIALRGYDTIKSYSCGCPYKEGACKHIVAVLLNIRDEIAKKQAVKKAVRAADKDSTKGVGKAYRQQIKDFIKSNTRKGFIDRSSSQVLAGMLRPLLTEADEWMKQGMVKEASILVKSLLAEVINVITCCDDSGGRISDTLFHIIQQLRTIAIAENTPTDIRIDIFDFLSGSLHDPIYFDYGDFGYELTPVYQALALQLDKQQPFLQFVDERLKEAASKTYSSYENGYFLSLKIAFLKATGQETEAQQLVQQHLHVVGVRQGEVGEAIDKGDFTVARKLIAEGIEIAIAENLWGVVDEWEKRLLQIAVLEKDIATVRSYTRKFAVDRIFDKEYYDQWKDTFSAAEWKEVIDAYISQVAAKVMAEYEQHKGRSWSSPYPELLKLLAPVYIEEQYWQPLLDLLSKEPDLVQLQKYHPYLYSHYRKELLALYLPAFEDQGDYSGSRNDYAKLAKNMKKVMELIPEGREAIIAIAEKLIDKHPRRPTMISELEKIIG